MRKLLTSTLTVLYSRLKLARVPSRSKTTALIAIAYFTLVSDLKPKTSPRNILYDNKRDNEAGLLGLY
jgi:hypothetical protein